MDSVQYNELGNEVFMSFRFDRSRSTNRWNSPDEKVFIDVLGKLLCQSTGDVHVITNRKYVIGNGTACHLNLQGDSISKMHCMLITDGNKAVVVNLSSDCQILVNGETGSGVSVKDGDLLTVGQNTFKFATQQSNSSS